MISNLCNGQAKQMNEKREWELQPQSRIKD